MAYEIPVMKHSMKASASLSGKQFLAAKVSGNLTVNVAGAGELSIGIIQNEPGSGEAAELMSLGVSKVVLGGTVVAGDLLKADAAGKLVAGTSGDICLAVALEGGAANEIKSALVMPGLLMA